MIDEVVSFNSVSKIYKKSGFIKSILVPAITDISFIVNKGEIVGLLGLNGAGKTTIIKLICGIIKPTKGNIKLFGSDKTIELKKKIGYLPELPYFYPYLTPLNSLIYYGKLSGLSSENLEEKAIKILKKVGLGQKIYSRNYEFSKGMLQRLGIAQALLHNPEFLILDEPVSGLDPIAIKDIRNLILELNGEGKTIFLSSHSISELEKVCHRVFILNMGKIHYIIEKREWENASGKLEDIFVNAVSQKSKEFEENEKN